MSTSSVLPTHRATSPLTKHKPGPQAASFLSLGSSSSEPSFPRLWVHVLTDWLTNPRKQPDSPAPPLLPLLTEAMAVSIFQVHREGWWRTLSKEVLQECRHPYPCGHPVLILLKPPKLNNTLNISPLMMWLKVYAVWIFWVFGSTGWVWFTIFLPRMGQDDLNPTGSQQIFNL